MRQPDSPDRNKIVYQVVFQLMSGFIEKKASVLDLLSQPIEGLRIVDNALEFTIPALHKLVESRLAGLDKPLEIGYKSFRKLLFTSTLNMDLRRIGAEVVVHQSSGKVDSGVYRLNLVNPVGTC